jgi:HemY protein
MRRTLLILLTCAVVIGAAIWLATLPGGVRFEAGDLSVDAATPTVVQVGLIGLLLFYLVVRGLGALIRLPRRIKAARLRRRRRDGDAAVTRTLVALAAGHQSDAIAASSRARRLLGDTPHTLLLTAQAHQLAGRDDDAAAHFNALADHPEAGVVGLRGLLHQAMARRDWAAAEVLADRAERAYPNSAWLREERAKLTARPGALPGADDRRQMTDDR